MKKLGRAFLVLSAGLSSALVVVAVASGSQAQVTQKALEAPRPAGAGKEVGLVEQVACASAKNCAALGGWLYTDLASKWKAGKVPVAAGTGGTNLRSLDCPAAGKCEAVGLAGLQHAVYAVESGRQWTIGKVELPADAVPLDPPDGPAPFLVSVDCASVHNCVAVGGYDAANRTARPLVVSESDGAWGAGVEPQLPANADTSPDPNQPGLGGVLSYISCPAAGDCTAVGLYTNKDAGHGYYPWVLTESGGTWSAGTGALLPADAAFQGDPERGGSPFFGFDGLSCPSAGNCTAVGGYEDRNGGEQGLILTERDGVWSRGVEAPLPAKAVPNSEPNEFNSPLASVSCSAPDDCAAVGWYVTKSEGTKHGLLLTERNGSWKASALVLPAQAKASGGVFPASVSCPSRGNCAAAGYYASGGKTHGLIVRERGGKWQRGVDAALPKGAAPASRSHTFLNSVSCPSASSCAAGGSYHDRSGKTQGLLLNVRLR
jgi:hypothetical protein